MFSDAVYNILMLYTASLNAIIYYYVTCVRVGESVDVYKGRLQLVPRSARGHGVTQGQGHLVAVKVLKRGCNERDLMTAASVLAQLDDPNILYLEGVVTRRQPIMIVTEFMHNSSLDQFLQASIKCINIWAGLKIYKIFC